MFLTINFSYYLVIHKYRRMVDRSGLMRDDSDLVLARLNFTKHLTAHFDNYNRSELSKFAATTGLSAAINRQVSAKRQIFELMSITISLIYKRNKSGPKIDP